LITSIKLWNEPNNLSHWDFLLDPGWTIYAEMVRLTARSLRAAGVTVPLVLGGMSPIDPGFLRRLAELGALDEVDVLAVHGFPLDWNLWPIEEWPERIEAVRREFGKPVWVTETGVSSYASEAVGEWGLRRAQALLRGEQVYWYSLMDLPPRYEATTRHKRAEGSSYLRHFHFGLLRWDGTPKRALGAFSPEMGICQWFQYRDERSLELAAEWLQRLGVRRVRTGLSWAESHIPGYEEWFDRVMAVLAPYEVSVTLCFTPPSRGLRADHTAPPRDVAEFAQFAVHMATRYGAAAPEGAQT
jgi:beta-xylosidase